MFDALSKVVSEQKIEDGVWTHIYREDDEGDKVFLYLDPIEKTLPCMALIRSDDSSIMREYNLKLGAKQITSIRRGKSGGNVDQAAEDLLNNEFQLLKRRLVSVKNLDSKQPDEQKLDDAAIKELMQNSANQWFIRFVAKVATDPKQFAPDVGNAEGDPPPPKKAKEQA
jgi:hypothetical protein